MQHQTDRKKQAQAATEPLIKNVLMSYIPVSDVKRAREWYMTVLGFKAFAQEGGILIMGSGQWFVLVESTDRPNANFATDTWNGVKGFEMFSLTFETDNIVALHDQLRDHGAEVEPITDNGGCGLQFLFKDPDGNRFNVWQN